MKKIKMVGAPIEFDNFLTDLARKEARENGDAPSKARVMRLMASQFDKKMVFRGKKIDIKIL